MIFFCYDYNEYINLKIEKKKKKDKRALYFDKRKLSIKVQGFSLQNIRNPIYIWSDETRQKPRLLGETLKRCTFPRKGAILKVFSCFKLFPISGIRMQLKEKAQSLDIGSNFLDKFKFKSIYLYYYIRLISYRD